MSVQRAQCVSQPEEADLGERMQWALTQALLSADTTKVQPANVSHSRERPHEVSALRSPSSSTYSGSHHICRQLWWEQTFQSYQVAYFMMLWSFWIPIRQASGNSILAMLFNKGLRPAHFCGRILTCLAAAKRFDSQSAGRLI